jgi:phosphatidylinositol alpha-1,6-mannosyltransferase
MIRRILIVTTDAGLASDGTYRPGGLQLFSRLVIRALAESVSLERLGVLSLLDSQTGVDRTLNALLAPVRSPQLNLDLHGCRGNRGRLALLYLREHWRYQLVLFLHINVARLAVLTPFSRVGLWLVGVEVRRRLSRHERFVVNRADPLLSISDYSTAEMQRYNPDLPGAQTVHLSIEPDEPWRSMAAPPPEPVFEAARRERAVLIVARMAKAERYKGHDQLIDAWSAVVDAQADASLWIVGEGDDTERLRARVQELPARVRARIEFLGRLDHGGLLERYARARVFAMPSTGEGFGLVFVEAMRAGLPCISSFDSAAEIVSDEQTGLVVPQEPGAIGQACIRLLADDALADRMSAAGRTRYEQRFTYLAFKQRLLATLGLH